jgi:hypothetical protein
VRNNPALSESLTVKVESSPDIEFNLPDTIEYPESILLLDLVKPSGGTFRGEGVDGNIFESRTTGLGRFQISYTLEGSCGGEVSASIVVVDFIDPVISPPKLSAFRLVDLYPNPTSGSLKLVIEGPVGSVQVEIFSPGGHLLNQTDLSLQAGKTEHLFQLNDWAGGHYFMRLMHKSSVIYRKIFLQP